jgi:lambda family phage minor tail protein L
MRIYSDIQKLEPGERVDLFELDARGIGAGQLFFHGYAQVGAIWWRGVEYVAWPIAADGFAMNGQGQQASPTLTVGDVQGSIASLCLAFDDLVGARLIRRTTLGRFLDAENFPGGNPSADPTEQLPEQIWLIEQRTSDDGAVITFQLSSPLDFNGVQLPRRMVVANSCWWLSCGGYRGPYCNYTGSAKFDLQGNPVSDSSKDKCAGTLSACKLRFGEGQQLNFGGFPGAGLIRS